MKILFFFELKNLHLQPLKIYEIVVKSLKGKVFS